MKMLKYIPLVVLAGFGLLQVPCAYAGGKGGKAGMVFPKHLTAEQIAQMIYEAAQRDPENAAVIYMEAISSRTDWTVPELVLISNALLIGNPNLTPSDLGTVMENGGVNPSDVEDVVNRLEDPDGPPPVGPVPTAPPASYPVVPTPPHVSGVN